VRIKSGMLPALTLAVFFWPGLSQGAQAEELGLWECVRAAVTDHPVVRAGLWRVAQSQAAVDEDQTLFKPDFSFGASYAANSYVAEIPLPKGPMALGGHHDAKLSLEAGHLLYDWGRRKNMLEGDIQLRQASSQSLRQLRERLGLEAGISYLRLLGARREMRIAGRSVETADAHYKHLAALNSQGLITYDEVLKGEVHLEQTRIMLNRSSNRVKLAQAQLLQQMGLPMESRVSFEDSAAGIPEPLPPEQGIELSLSRRPELAAYNARLSALESLGASVQADNKPAVRVFAAGNFARPGIDMYRNEWIGYARAGVGLDWKFWDWGRKDYRVSKIKAQWEETLAERRVLEQQIALELKSASLEEEEARDRLALAGKALQAADEHFRIVSARFDQAQVTNTEYLDAREQATISALEYSGAFVDLAIARWRLAYVSGQLAVEIESRWPGLAKENIEKAR